MEASSTRLNGRALLNARDDVPRAFRAGAAGGGRRRALVHPRRRVRGLALAPKWSGGALGAAPACGGPSKFGKK